MIVVDSDIDAWLRLTLIRGLGDASIIRLLKIFSSPDAILNASYCALSRYLPSALVSALRQGPTIAELDAAKQWLAVPNHHLISLADPDYPRLLLEIDRPPVVFYLQGRRDLLSKKTIAIVGSRHATAQGLANARAFARNLAEQDCCIVSGLALGVDSAAHHGALAALGSTIAVVATGLDRVYPTSNQALAEKISENGALISEFPLGTLPKPGHFPRRNRIISGLSYAVLVIEASLRSGSLITAREAIQQGREVFAIPGSIHSPLSKGCHALIKQGAKLVDSSADIFDELALIYKNDVVTPVTHPPIASDPIADQLLTTMGFEPINVDTLCSRTDLAPAKISAALLKLELNGQIASLPNGCYQRLSV